MVSGLELGGCQSQGRDVLPTRLLAQESEQLRSAAFAIYAAVLAKVRRRSLVFPLKHQVLNLLIPLVLHLQDRDTSVAQVSGWSLDPVPMLTGWGAVGGRRRAPTLESCRKRLVVTR